MPPSAFDTRSVTFMKPVAMIANQFLIQPHLPSAIRYTQPDPDDR